MSKTPREKSPFNKQCQPLLLVFTGLIQLLVAGTSGCRSTVDNQIDLLERELRTQENYIYELESYVVEYSEKLRDSRCEFPQQTAGYAEELIDAEPAIVPPKKNKSQHARQEKSIVEFEQDELPAPEEREDDSPITPRSAPEFSPEDLEIPDEIDVEMEDPVGTLNRAQPLRQAALLADAEFSDEHYSDNGQLQIPDPVEYVEDRDVDAVNPVEEAHAEDLAIEEMFEDELLEETAALAAPSRIANRLEVKRLFTSENGGESAPNLLTVVEAIDSRGEPVDFDGEVSVMVMSADGDSQQRIKRWNFTAAETQAAWQSTDLGDGIHLELPIEQAQLPNTPLELWVRLVSADGRKLLTQLPFDLGQLSDIATADPAPLHNEPTTPSLAEIEASAEPLNPIRIARQPAAPSTDSTKIVKAPANSDQPQWRASMERMDRTASGFATSKSKSLGWTKQSLSQQSRPPARIAVRTAQPQPSTLGQGTASPSNWTSEQGVETSESQHSSAVKVSSGWSTSR